MTHMLQLDASLRGERSISCQLSKAFVANWKVAHPHDTVTYRDLGYHPVPLVDEPWIAAAYSAPDQHTPEQAAAIRSSNALVDEFLHG
nr:NAD(P)H-dependent oxidoreductase [Leptolyngbya sp. FACHB-321]